MEIYVYINYPNCHFTIYNNPHCKRIRQHNNINQRKFIIINRHEFADFLKKRHEFESKPPNNDMWLKIDLGSQEYNRELVSKIKKVIGKHYEPFLTAPIRICC